jgi:hypothetical protein
VSAASLWLMLLNRPSNAIKLTHEGGQVIVSTATALGRPLTSALVEADQGEVRD